MRLLCFFDCYAIKEAQVYKMDTTFGTRKRVPFRPC